MTRKVLILTFAALGLGAVALFAAEAAKAQDPKTGEKATIETEAGTEPIEYVFRHKNRISPFKMQLLSGGDVPDTVAKQELTREQQEALVVQCEKLSVRMIPWAKQKLFDKVMEASSQIAEIRARVTDNDLLGKLEKIQENVDRQLGTVMKLKEAVLWRTASRLLEEMKADFADEKYGLVLSRYNTVSQRVKDFKPTPGEQMSDKIVKLAEELQKLSLRASIRAEFLRRLPNVDGVFIFETSRSAIIDGVGVKEGEKIGKITIVRVEAGPKITFLYRGERIVIEYDLNKMMTSK